MSDLKLSEREERFAQNFSLWRDATKAYRATFDCSRMKENTVWRNAWEFKSRPVVLARIEELRAITAQEVTRDLSSMIADLAMISLADPSKLTRHERNNCRHCHGRGHKWQWKNEGEYSLALAAVMDENADLERRQQLAPAGHEIHAREPKPLPDVSGGLGFVIDAFPDPDCPACLGEGVARVWIADMRRLGPYEAKLYAGIKETKDGLQVLTRDQDGAADKILRILGAYKDGLPAAILQRMMPADPATGAQDVVTMPLDQQAAADFYMDFVKGKQ